MGDNHDDKHDTLRRDMSRVEGKLGYLAEEIDRLNERVESLEADDEDLAGRVEFSDVPVDA